MKEFSLELSKDYQRPIIKIDNLDAIIDTGAMIPTFSIPAPIIEKLFDAKKILSNGVISGFGGDCKGAVYEIKEFTVGELKFRPFQFFVPNIPVTKHPFLLSASMFYGTDYDFNTIEGKFVVRVNNDADLIRSFQLKDLSGKLYAQIGNVLIQDNEYFQTDEIDNYIQNEEKDDINSLELF